MITRRAVGAAAGWATANPTLIPGIPAGTQAGDVMVMLGYNRAASSSFADPAGWDRQLHENGGAGPRLYLATRVAGSSESAPSVVTSGAPAGSPTNAFIVSYVGVDPTDPIDVIGAYSLAGAGAAAALTGISPGARARAIFAFCFEQDDWTSNNPPSGDGLTWAEVFDTVTELGSDGGMALAEALDYESGAIAAKSFSISPAPAANGGYLFSLNADVLEVERAVAIAGTLDVSAGGERIVDRSVGIQAELGFEAAFLRELERSVTIEAAVGLEVGRERIIERAVEIAVASAIDVSYLRELERGVSLALASTIEVGRQRIIERAVEIAAALDISIVAEQGGVVARSVSISAQSGVEVGFRRELERAVAIAALAEIQVAGEIDSPAQIVERSVSIAAALLISAAGIRAGLEWPNATDVSWPRASAAGWILEAGEDWPNDTD